MLEHSVSQTYRPERYYAETETSCGIIPHVVWLLVPMVRESVNHYGISTKQKQHVPAEKVCMSFWSVRDVSPASNLDPARKLIGLLWSILYHTL